jgi:A/G-specific adenine glycosylase
VSAYHYPLLVEDGTTAEELLKWFEGIEEARNMPWRKKWLDPAEWEEGEEKFGGLLERRAYEVWVSEVSELHPGDGFFGAVCFAAREVSRTDA